jgi:hypothetical protein
LHQDQRERLPKLAGDIFDASAGDKAVSFVEAVMPFIPSLERPNRFKLTELLLHQDQRERLPKLAGDIFDASARDKAMSFVEAVIPFIPSLKALTDSN